MEKIRKSTSLCAAEVSIIIELSNCTLFWFILFRKKKPQLNFLDQKIFPVGMSVGQFANY